MAGGDGSQALVATVAMRHDVAHVCIPSARATTSRSILGSTGRCRRRARRVQRREGAADRSCSGDERVFVNNASLGVYAQIVQSDAYPRRQARDLGAAAARDARPRRAGDRPGFQGARQNRVRRRAAGAGLEQPYELTGLGGAGTRPRLDTGRLGIVAARIRSASDVAELVTLETIGGRNAFVACWNGRSPSSRSARAHRWPWASTVRRSCSNHRSGSSRCPGAPRPAAAERRRRLSGGGCDLADRNDLAVLLRVAAGRPDQ